MLLEPLSEDQIAIALKNAGYTRKQLDSDLEQLKEWLKLQHHLPPSRLKEPDSFLEIYLTGCKGSMETAKRKLDNYYTNRRHSDYLYGNRDPIASPYVDDKETNYIVALPKPTKEGYRITLSKMADCDPEKFNHANGAKNVINLLEIRLRLETICCGDIIIWDGENFSSSHILKLIPNVIRDLLTIVQEISPIRIKKMFFINTSPLLDVAINNLAKPFMNKKMKERIIVTSNGYEELYKHFDKKLLPKDLGGELNKTLHEYSDDWKKEESSLRDWFINDLSELTDESKRVNKDDNNLNNAYFGLHGSLKKLIID